MGPSLHSELECYARGWDPCQTLLGHGPGLPPPNRVTRRAGRLTHRSPSDADSVSGVPPIRLALLKHGAESCNRSLRPYCPTGLRERATSREARGINARGADRTGAGGNPASGRLERVERVTHGELVRLPRGSRDGSESGPSGTVSRKRQRPLKALVGTGRRQRPIFLAGHRSIYPGTSLGRSELDELRPSKPPFGILGGRKPGCGLVMRER